MNPGVYYSLSNLDYHSGEGTSKSGLDILHRSPMHFAFAKSAANDNIPTAAQAFGSAFHALVLESELFVRDYCLALRREDEPDAIDERDTLVAMVQELNLARLPKLSTTGSKAELLARVVDHCGTDLLSSELDAMKAADLKAIIDGENAKRPGLLPVSGTRHELAEILRANGKPVRLWSDVQAQWMQNNGHRTVLSAEQWEALHGMRDAVMAHPAASRLLTAKPGHAEVSFYWTDPHTGELLRCRPDFLRDDGIVVDLKSTDDASAEAFARSVANYRYHVQAPFYIDGINEAIRQADIDMAPAKAFVFIAVEKKPPYAVAVYALDAESMEVGRLEYRADLNALSACRASNVWPGYGDTIQSLSLPAWKFARVAV